MRRVDQSLRSEEARVLQDKVVRHYPADFVVPDKVLAMVLDACTRITPQGEPIVEAARVSALQRQHKVPLIDSEIGKDIPAWFFSNDNPAFL